MSLNSMLSKTKLPNLKELKESKDRAKTDIEKTNINLIDCLYISKDWRHLIPTKALLDRSTNVTIAKLQKPDDLGVIILDSSLLLNLVTKIETLIVMEGNIFSSNLSKEINDEKVIKEISKFISKNPKIKNITLPMSINNVKIGEYTITIENDNGKEELMTITQKFISQTGYFKFFEGMAKPKNDGLIIALFIGVFIGVIGGSFTMAYIIG